jgi:hypothetical protein
VIPDDFEEDEEKGKDAEGTECSDEEHEGSVTSMESMELAP